MINRIVNVVSMFGVIIAAIGVYLTYCSLDSLNKQMTQTHEQLTWQNYNHLNERYSNLMTKLAVAAEEGKTFENLSHENKWVIRQYFDLTSEEYWLYMNNLLPEEMWEHRILPGLKINIKSELISEGFSYWQSQGAFNHPEGFIDLVLSI